MRGVPRQRSELSARLASEPRKPRSGLRDSRAQLGIAVLPQMDEVTVVLHSPFGIAQPLIDLRLPEVGRCHVHKFVRGALKPIGKPLKRLLVAPELVE